jgi:hypothetical protein
MSTPILHHYIPRFYLQRFADQDSRLIAFRRSTQKTVRTSPKVIAAENHFYSVTGPSGEKSPVVEEYLAKVEGRASQAMRKIDEGHFPPIDEDRDSLTRFLALLYTRTREVRHVGEEFAKFESAFRRHGLTRDSVRSHLHSKYQREPTEEEIDEILESITVATEEPGRDDMVRAMLRMAGEIRPAIDQLRHWHLLVAKEQPAYLTSDHPIALWRESTPQNQPRGIGWRSCDAVIFPLDPSTALVLRREDHGSPPVIPVSAQVVEQVNGLIAHGSYEWVFHNPGHDPLKDIALASRRALFYMGDIPVYGDGQGVEAFRREMEPFSPVIFEDREDEQQSERPPLLTRMKAFLRGLLRR